MELAPLAVLAALVGGYLLGSIPFGVLVTRSAGVGDVRQIGSGNIGATNVLRTGRRDLALLTLLGDGGKGAVAVLIARGLIGFDAPGSLAMGAIAGGAAFLGHLFPVWLKFKGGKGVATFFGILFAAAWPVGIACALAWLAMAALFRFSSLAALTAAALAAVWAFLLHAGLPVIYLAVFTAVLIFVRHRENIARLTAGTEPRIGAGKGAPAPPAGRA